jgi:hypothetical protein
MEKSAIVAGALAFALSACSSAPTTVGGGTSAAPSSTVPVHVVIKGGKIIAPNDTYTYPNHTEIQWTIITPGAYTFPDNGIVFQQPGVFVCHPHQGGSITFTCKKNGHPRDKYKYTVNVNDGSTPLYPLDPWIYNE